MSGSFYVISNKASNCLYSPGGGGGHWETTSLFIDTTALLEETICLPRTQKLEDIRK